MKKIFLLLTLSIISILTCHAQLTHTGEFVKINLPNGVHKVNKQQVDALSMDKLPINTIKVYSPYLYQVDNISLGLNNVNEDSNNNDMAGNKRFLDELYSSMKHHGNNSYKSVIKNIGSKQVLIAGYNDNGVSHYRFYIQNAAKTLMQSGKIDYQEADSAKAEALLNEIINSIQFTK
ncbi:MAG: hypothetical protein V4456_03410 [Bacteroidota bacterium]